MQTIIKNKKFVVAAGILFVSLICCGMFIVGCKGEEEVKRPEERDLSLKQFIMKYEKTFTPSDYNPDINLLKEKEKKEFAALHPAAVATQAPPETIPGFRIQVFLTQEIDRVNAVHDSVATFFPEELVYVVYDSPYYKVRLGNYTDRQSANPILRKLIELGYKESWVVPDNVLKNPPQRLPDVFIEPQRSPDNHN